MEITLGCIVSFLTKYIDIVSAYPEWTLVFLFYTENIVGVAVENKCWTSVARCEDSKQCLASMMSKT